MKNLTILNEFLTGEEKGYSAWHWYDFTCPFCYVGKDRNRILERNGFGLINLPFQAHPEVPSEGLFMGERKGKMYELLEQEANEAGLPLKWPLRLPNSRYALAVAEQVRRNLPNYFGRVEDRLFAAHFVLGEDLSSRDTVHKCLNESGISDSEINNLLKEDAGFHNVEASESAAKTIGVRGTPAWVVNGQLISGLHSRGFFDGLGVDPK